MLHVPAVFRLISMEMKVYGYTFSSFSQRETSCMTSGYLFWVMKPFQNWPTINLLGAFHCYLLDESICHFKGDGSILSLLFFYGKSC